MSLSWSHSSLPTLEKDKKGHEKNKPATRNSEASTHKLQFSHRNFPSTLNRPRRVSR